jgi:cytoskeleton protein RodZ
MPEVDEEESLGQMLREARESKGMSIDDVADQLNIELAKIKMIEQDEYDLEAPDAVFIRGYIRSYARLVGLSEDQAGDLFQELGVVSSKKKQQESRKIKIKEISSKDKPVRLITNFVIIILIILVLIWWYSHYVANTSNGMQPSAISEISAQPAVNTNVQTPAAPTDLSSQSAKTQENKPAKEAPATNKTTNRWINPDLSKK